MESRICGILGLTDSLHMPLQYESQASHIYDKLKNLPRTGWVMHGVPHPETVYDHTVSLVAMAIDMQTDLDLSDSQLEDLSHILEVHDWGEAIVGDQVILDKNPDDYASKKRAKQAKERLAMEELLNGREYKSDVLTAWEQYEAGTDDIAKLAKQLDKYQAVELALTYEAKYGIELFTEFDTYSKQHIEHPALLSKLQQLRERHAYLQRTK